MGTGCQGSQSAHGGMEGWTDKAPEPRKMDQKNLKKEKKQNEKKKKKHPEEGEQHAGTVQA